MSSIDGFEGQRQVVSCDTVIQLHSVLCSWKKKLHSVLRSP